MTVHTDKFMEIYRKPEYNDPAIDFPLIISVEIKGDKREFINPNTFYMKVLEQAKENGAKGIRLEGRGDPLTHRHIIAFILAIKRKQLLASLTTSGYLLYLGIDSILNSGLNTLEVKVTNHIAKQALGILRKRRKEEPFVRVFADVPELEAEYKDYCDEFEYKSHTTTAKLKNEMFISWDGVVHCGDFEGLYYGISTNLGKINDNDLHKLWNLKSES